MPGTPVVYYGDELGMGDNIYLGDRNGVRTPMQWTGDRNAGFSRADPARLFAPPVMDPVYGYQAINVEAQERAPFSLLNWMKRMIGLRKQFQVFGRGTIEFLPAENRKILAYLRRYKDDEILCVANLSRSVQPVELDLSRFKGRTPVEMLFLTEFPTIGELPYFLTLPGYFSYWFRLQQSPSPISARVPHEAAPVREAPALFMGVAWDTLLDGNVRTLIERDLLIPFLQRQRWFGGKARRVRSARFIDWGVLRRGAQPLFVTIVDVNYEDGERDSYFLPLAICAAAEARGVEERSPQRGAGAGDRRAQGSALRRVARQRLRPRAARDVRAAAGRPLAARRAGAGADQRICACPRRRPARRRPVVRRAEQHVPRVRESTDPQAVQAPAARHQPRLRDRPSADRARRLSASTDGCRRPGIPDGRGATGDRRDAATAGREPGRRLAPCDR